MPQNVFSGPPLLSSSFLDALHAYAPHLLDAPIREGQVSRPEAGTADGLGAVPHATTIVALRFEGGVVMGGDRRATEGLSIAQRDIEKVFPADDFSAVGIAGAAGPAIEMVRLFQTELEHYEKIEGFGLSLQGKANKLGQMIRANLPMAMQGLAVVPLFCGYDLRAGIGRIYRYDVTGGRYEDENFYSIGSGGRDARATLRKRYRAGLSAADSISIVVEALYDAADEDAGTGGPDLIRGIFPVVAQVTAEGFSRVEDDAVRSAAERVIAARVRGEG